MRELILHIGRHKSGTTAIQHFLNDNRDELLRRGVHVPRAGRRGEGHHALAEPLRRRLARLSGLTDPRSLAVWRALVAELHGIAPELVAVISSEAFQNCEASLVARGIGGFRTRVLVYLRNQVDYLASAYAQRVHATDYCGSVEDFYRDIFLPLHDYERFLQGWETQFPGQLTVRRYRPGTMVQDFAAAAFGMEDLSWATLRAAANPSLNAQVLEFKRRLNARGPADAPPPGLLYRVLPELNARCPAPKFRVPEALRRDLVARAERGDSAVAARYFGEAQLFDYSPGAAAAEPLPPLSDAEFRRMYNCLQDLAAAMRPRGA